MQEPGRAASTRGIVASERARLHTGDLCRLNRFMQEKLGVLLLTKRR